MKSCYSKIKDRIVNPASLTTQDIENIKAWRKSKLKTMFTYIVNNPGILTHNLQSSSRINNVPNAVDLVNAKLRALGYEVDCVPTALKNKESYCWYLLTLNNGV